MEAYKSTWYQFTEHPDSAFDGLGHYLHDQVDAIVEQYGEQEYIPFDQLKENLATLSTGVSDISEVVSSNSRQVIGDTVNSYRHLLKTRSKSIADWVSTPLGCALNGFDYYAKTMTQVSEILYRTRDTLTKDELARPKSIEKVQAS